MYLPKPPPHRLPESRCSPWKTPLSYPKHQGHLLSPVPPAVLLPRSYRRWLPLAAPDAGDPASPRHVWDPSPRFPEWGLGWEALALGPPSGSVCRGTGRAACPMPAPSLGGAGPVWRYTKHRQQSALDGCPEEPRAVPRPLSRWDSWEEALFLSPYPGKGQPQGKQTPPQPGTKGQRSTSPRAAHPLPTHHHQGNTGRPSPNAPRLLCKDQRASLRAPSWELQHHQVQGDLGHRTGDAAVRRHQGDGMNL